MTLLIAFGVILVIAVLLKYIMNVVMFNDALKLFNRTFTKNRIFSNVSRNPSIKKRIQILKYQRKIAHNLQIRIQTMEKYAFLPVHKRKFEQAAGLYNKTFAKFVTKKK